MILSRPRVLGAAAVVAALPVVAAPAAAQAASGATTIHLKGATAKALTAHVKITARKPARASARSLSLPIAGGTVAKGALLRNGGSVTFRAGRRSATLTSWQTRVTTSGSQVSAKLAGRRLTVFTIRAPKQRISLDTATKAASLAGGSAKLTAAAAKALRTRLALRRLPAGAFGSAKVTAKLGTSGGGRTTTPGGGTTNPGGGTTTPTPTPRPPSCEGRGTGEVQTAADPLTPPVDALRVTNAPMRWYARDSWVRYVSAASIVVTAPAKAGPVETYPEPTPSFRDPSTSPPLSYGVDFAFDPSRSWYSPAGRTGYLAYTGSVRYLWEAHGIDLTFANPEVEINGAASRMVFTVTGAACSNLPAKRVAVLKLAAGTPSANGTSYAFSPLAASITDAGAALLSNMYFENDYWGSIRNLTVTTG